MSEKIVVENLDPSDFAGSFTSVIKMMEKLQAQYPNNKLHIESKFHRGQYEEDDWNDMIIFYWSDGTNGSGKYSSFGPSGELFV